ncbi:dipeptide ABC transporter ATP-binding protein [Nocardia africana]|uniref:Glutathione import ATP-binding protein GsiA n=1 Tax=Nocardia africana TaxID=134964 RepID=A0A378WVJ8_9NOCA|nr:ABC transporter ATP-binding protein [Nocardia africana]MCC3313849.1 ABC transporter ATP-binding protein [Nocardia africana]SUA44767.1 Glutathione import ATP-binding protein GsiA [Nocardia africana]
MTTTGPLLRIDDLTVRYRDAAGPAVSGVSLEVAAGEFVSIVGESGSGKSTTIHAALRLLPPAARVRARALEIGGHDVSRWSDRRLARVRGPVVGFVPQDPGTSLNPVKPVGRQVLDALRLHRRADAGRDLVVEKLAAAGLAAPERVYRQYPHELSGGMKQRVLIAIALANDPVLLVADEPTSALDVTVQKRILDRLTVLREELGLGVLLVTHDLGVAAERSDRLLVMQRGRIVEQGAAAAVLSAPRHDYTRALLAAAPAAHPGRLVPSPGVPVRPAVASAQPVLRLSEVTKGFGGVRAVDEVTLAVRAGTTHAIVGESGAGKSTLARLVVGLQRPEAGAVWLDDVRVDGRGRRPRSLRWQIQLVYQNPYTSLDPRFDVAAIIGEPLQAFGLIRDRAARRRRVAELLDAVALDRAHLSRRPAELSGGQRQRVAIARALAAEPRVLVLDEAVSALDVSVQAQILQLLTDLQAEHGLTYLFITHDLGVVRLIADDVSVMRHGRVIETGSVASVFEEPREDYTRTLLAAVPDVRVRLPVPA